jgi:hypothetical protein
MLGPLVWPEADFGAESGCGHVGGTYHYGTITIMARISGAVAFDVRGLRNAGLRWRL